jgi:hypothetical protein
MHLGIVQPINNLVHRLPESLRIVSSRVIEIVVGELECYPRCNIGSLNGRVELVIKWHEIRENA